MTESQAEFAYNDSHIVTFEKYLSPERLAAYIQHARGDKWVAIRLYERNTELSEALYGVIQGLEVTLRNAIHVLLTEKLGSATWYEGFPLEETERESVEDAKRKVSARPAEITPGRIVAELTFAFWVRLFSSPYDKSLWVPYLSRIFPLKLQAKRGAVHGRLVELKTLRNRIAHHERITCGRRVCEADYQLILETIGWISPSMRDWVTCRNCFEERFAKRLPKKPKVSPANLMTDVSAEPVQATDEVPLAG